MRPPADNSASAESQIARRGLLNRGFRHVPTKKIEVTQHQDREPNTGSPDKRGAAADCLVHPVRQQRIQADARTDELDVWA